MSWAPPAAIVAAAHPGRPPERRGAREAFALVLLVLGFPPVLGWAIGAGLLLWSPLWTARQKLLGLLVWPGGLLVFGAVPFLFASRSEACVSSVPVCEVGQSCESIAPILPNCVTSGTPWWPVVLAVILVLAPLAMATYLWLAAGRRSAQAGAYGVE